LALSGVSYKLGGSFSAFRLDPPSLAPSLAIAMDAQVLLGSQADTSQLLLVSAFFLSFAQEVFQLDEGFFHLNDSSSAVDELSRIFLTFLYCG
jgi:hypothetical protein